jgi:hypothetical protein
MPNDEDTFKDLLEATNHYLTKIGRVSNRIHESDGSVIESNTLLEDAAICLDDCLKLMMPEEFTSEQVDFAKRRMFANGGRLARIATTADNLRAASNTN